MTENERTIRNFIAAWSRLDPVELADYFAEDGTYYMPAAPISGRESVEAFIRGFTASWTETTWEILNLASDADRVFVERLDRTKAGDRAVDLPCLGIFELENGKIKIWRDYFDLATYQNGLID